MLVSVNPWFFSDLTVAADVAKEGLCIGVADTRSY